LALRFHHFALVLKVLIENFLLFLLDSIKDFLNALLATHLSSLSLSLEVLIWIEGYLKASNLRNLLQVVGKSNFAIVALLQVLNHAFFFIVFVKFSHLIGLS